MRKNYENKQKRKGFIFEKIDLFNFRRFDGRSCYVYNKDYLTYIHSQILDLILYNYFNLLVHFYFNTV